MAAQAHIDWFLPFRLKGGRRQAADSWTLLSSCNGGQGGDSSNGGSGQGGFGLATGAPLCPCLPLSACRCLVWDATCGGRLVECHPHPSK